MSRLCPPCADEWQRWLDYQWGQPYRRWVEGFGGDRGGRLSGYNYAARAQERAETIRFQQGLIRRTCTENHRETT